jgi:hypothetical protein
MDDLTLKIDTGAPVEVSAFEPDCHLKHELAGFKA